MTAKKTEMPLQDTAPEQKSKRTVVIGGVAYPVVRTYYDVKRDIVNDVYEKTKTVPTRKGDRDITIQKHILCREPAIQKKHRRGDKTEIEVNVDVE